MPTHAAHAETNVMMESAHSGPPLAIDRSNGSGTPGHGGMPLTLLTVPIASITVSPQVRQNIDPEGLRELAASIASVGLQQPPLCLTRGAVYELIDGHRRLCACGEFLGWTEMPILAFQGSSESANVLARQLVCNLQRADLNAIERALGIQALMTQAALSADGVAKMLGLSSASVTRSLSLLTLPEDIRKCVADGRIPADSAYQLSTVSDSKHQAVLAAEVAGKRLTRDALARKLKSSRRSNERRTDGIARCIAMMGGGRSVTFVGKGLSLDAAIDWLEQLLARARKAKSQGLTLETFVRALRDQASERKGVTP